jgi:hypothetical protein
MHFSRLRIHENRKGNNVGVKHRINHQVHKNNREVIYRRRCFQMRLERAVSLISRGISLSAKILRHLPNQAFCLCKTATKPSSSLTHGKPHELDTPSKNTNVLSPQRSCGQRFRPSISAFPFSHNSNFIVQY